MFGYLSTTSQDSFDLTIITSSKFIVSAPILISWAQPLWLMWLNMVWLPSRQGTADYLLLKSDGSYPGSVWFLLSVPGE